MYITCYFVHQKDQPFALHVIATPAIHHVKCSRLLYIKERSSQLTTYVWYLCVRLFHLVLGHFFRFKQFYTTPATMARQRLFFFFCVVVIVCVQACACLYWLVPMSVDAREGPLRCNRLSSGDDSSASRTLRSPVCCIVWFVLVAYFSIYSVTSFTFFFTYPFLL